MNFLNWKTIPFLFIIWLVIQLNIFYYVQERLPDLQKIGFPRTLEQAQQFSQIMQKYLETNYYTLLFFQMSNFLFLQTWCIPGTFIFNLLGGALFGLKVGLPACIFCNTLGALNCFLISKYFMKSLIKDKLEIQLKKFKKKVEQNKNGLFFYMLSARIFPGSPNWAMNITFPHLQIPIHYFVLSIAIGLIPWNFLTCSAGQIISTFKSKDEIMRTENYLMLMGLAVGILLPTLIKKCLTFRQKSNKEI